VKPNPARFAAGSADCHIGPLLLVHASKPCIEHCKIVVRTTSTARRPFHGAFRGRQMQLDTDVAHELARTVALKAGASGDVAASLADATVSAEVAGSHTVGFSHLPDYLDGLRDGRISGNSEPEVSYPAAAMIEVNAKRGIAQLGFDRVFEELVTRVNAYGVTVFAQSNSFTVGELGYYTRRLAEAGLVALATTNGPAQMTTHESGKAVFGTNPLSFAAPVAGSRPFVIDQATSATAFVNVRQAAEQNEPIPEGWAIDSAGRPTSDAREAVKGLLLAFGGARGAHIAFISEILTAGMTGGNWSIDAPSFCEGDDCPSVGLFIVAIKPDLVVKNFEERLAAQIERLASKGVRIPGSHIKFSPIELPDNLLAVLQD